MAWVQWDTDKGFQGIVRGLPDTLQGRDSASLALLGFRELVVAHPENYIARFPALLGSSTFTLLKDGRVRQTFPDADFSVSRVRAELKRQTRESAGRELGKTDWYVTRAMELNTDAAKIPKDVQKLRQKIRDHVDWLDAKIDDLSPRELVDFQWKYPQSNEQTMVNGVPTMLDTPPPPPVPTLEEPPAEHQTGAGFDPDAEQVWGNADPSLVDPAPPAPPAPEVLPPPATTDGPVPLVSPGEEFPHLDPEGFPLVTAFAPTVEDTGPRPDQQ